MIPIPGSLNFPTGPRRRNKSGLVLNNSHTHWPCCRKAVGSTTTEKEKAQGGEKEADATTTTKRFCQGIHGRAS